MKAAQKAMGWSRTKPQDTIYHILKISVVLTAVHCIADYFYDTAFFLKMTTVTTMMGMGIFM